MTPFLTDEQLGDRHMFAFDRTARDGFLPGRIRICATATTVTTRAGQVTLWFLANLLSRQFQIVRKITFSISPAATLPDVALFGEQPELLDTLIATVKAVAGDRIVVERSGHQIDTDDVIVWVGPQPADQVERARTVAVWGSGWRVFIGPAIDLPETREITANPLGAIFAACFAAGECFRFITNWAGNGREPVRGRFISLWDGSTGASWEEVSAGIWPETVHLPPFYLCGAGAVGQATVAALALCPQRAGHAVILDHDLIDAPNLNRYPLAHLGSIDADKTELAANYLRSDTFTVEAVPKWWDDYVIPGQHRSRHPRLAAAEAEFKYELVLSCVDKNPARHSIQNYWPRLIMGGSTFRLGAQVMRYDCSSLGECLKCSNPLPHETSIEEKTAVLQALPRDQLEAALATLPAAAREATLRYLAEPKCGMAGEEHIDELGRRIQREFAVGFVSVGAGTLLAAALIQHSLGQGGMFSHAQNALLVSFQSNSVRNEFFPRQAGCSCGGSNPTLYHQLWGA